MDQINYSMMYSASQSRGNKTGFSLIELLTVLAIITALSSLAAPAFNSIAMGSRLSLAGQIVRDQFALARQEAVTKNREVQVRIFELPDGGRGIQLWRADEDAAGIALHPVGRISVLPQGVTINSDIAVSPLLSAGGISGQEQLPAYGEVNYTAFRFRPTGAADAGINPSNNYLTLQYAQAPGNPPGNYYTLQVNPVTGKLTTYRP